MKRGINFQQNHIHSVRTVRRTSDNLLLWHWTITEIMTEKGKSTKNGENIDNWLGYTFSEAALFWARSQTLDNASTQPSAGLLYRHSLGQKALKLFSWCKVVKEFFVATSEIYYVMKTLSRFREKKTFDGFGGTCEVYEMSSKMNQK